MTAFCSQQNSIPLLIRCLTAYVKLRLKEYLITRLAMRQLHDEYGNTYLCVDEAMRRRLEIKLITGILAFRAA